MQIDTLGNNNTMPVMMMIKMILMILIFMIMPIKMITAWSVTNGHLIDNIPQRKLGA